MFAVSRNYNRKEHKVYYSLKAYEYIVNGKSALDWIVQRYCVKTDQENSITIDINDWGLETENNPKYSLELSHRFII